jgi:hypothetical protein
VAETRDTGVEANGRLTAMTGIALFVLLAAAGITILRIHRLLPAHFFIGLLLIPPVALKMTSTGYRFVRYYMGDPDYRRAGPPPALLRLVAPVVVASTLVVFATGLELWLFGLRFGSVWLTAHKVSFVIWFVATAVHVLGHLARAPRLALADLQSHGAIPGTITRSSLVGGSLLLGIVLALSTLAWQSPFVSLPDN